MSTWPKEATRHSMTEISKWELTLLTSASFTWHVHLTFLFYCVPQVSAVHSCCGWSIRIVNRGYHTRFTALMVISARLRSAGSCPCTDTGSFSHTVVQHGCQIVHKLFSRAVCHTEPENMVGGFRIISLF